MAFIGLAASKVIKRAEIDMKFCEGEDCKKEVALKDFPKVRGGKYCKRCASKNQQKRYYQTKDNREMFF